jgi:putative SOS response-associated peptidase YedK
VEIGVVNSYVTYVEPASIRKAESIVTMEHLWDFTVPQYTQGNKRFRSLKARSEYDCKEKRVRVLASSFYEGKQADGATIQEDANPSGWITIGAKSSWLPLWEHACK